MIRSDIRSLTAYHVPDSSGLIKLDAMENPYTLPDNLRSEWSHLLSSSNINRYPDADMLDLRRRIAEREGVDADQVLIGNGSDEIIQMLIMAADPGACAVPKPTFVMYEHIAKWLKRPVASMPLKADFSLDAMAFLNMCAREKASLAFLSCPNNPTGNMWPREDVQQIADNFRGLLIIDEAYGPFATDTYRDMITRNVMLLRTFSKLGMAGLRLGYALGDAAIIADLNKVRLPYNINSLTQLSASFFLEHYAVFEEQAKMICQERERMSTALSALDKLEVFPSQANFLLLRVANATAVFEGLKQAGILIKNLHAKGSLLEGCLRVTIGLPEENDRFVNALKELI
ncbi:MAG: histidinol-phosphate transaminase [Zetaproteobacteria bacterium CG12_big_fil_rev_8_21_14_0_65_55_1124]|nr:MAG: histidinol-phosphate transaminase [Zetaproteobacteria bacterium CG08_land_8_20_14_0_20_55_17]PIW41980.1 MAG: histidinol-phosphate transaminase [Zetaproteobacteria bacterium CG12_big_fil_rev_8_21_14_0_65_55_1124]PIY53858.1 MAG: histidinol-phosphate transaminase [Zetaproteobacteria bacterium CG_4_10_14_0_8_um_filter_55_43]PIZ37036.1 MAG: histidinol-phosphate transaminase [Zetaproteobacteria bacterium CG_4_10_14_0_2_um_filter_55_20]PJB82947.1 MAG: histidinol-phosphate transaminase [Zetapro